MAVKSLGTKIDAKLSMAQQVSAVVGTCIGLLRQLRKLSPLLTFATLRRAVSALILSRLDYGNSLYSGISQQLLARLQVVMNDTARLIFKKPRRAYATPLLRDLHRLPVRQRIKFKGLRITDKTLYGQAPRNIKDRLTNYVPRRALRSAEANLLVCPRFNLSSMGGRVFSTSIPQAWNSLLASLRKEANLLPFRKKLKTLLFSEAWGNI